MKNMLCPHVTSAAPYEIENVVHPPHENLFNLCNLWAMNRFAACKNTLHLCLRITGREILVSSRLGPRMESAVNMNRQAHDNISAPTRQNDDDDGCSKCTATAPILLLQHTDIQ